MIKWRIITQWVHKVHCMYYAHTKAVQLRRCLSSFWSKVVFIASSILLARKFSTKISLKQEHCRRPLLLLSYTYTVHCTLRLLSNSIKWQKVTYLNLNAECKIDLDSGISQLKINYMWNLISFRTFAMPNDMKSIDGIRRQYFPSLNVSFYEKVESGNQTLLTNDATPGCTFGLQRLP